MTVIEICQSDSKIKFGLLQKFGLLEEIKTMTSFLDQIYDKPSYSQRIWHVKNNCFKIQLCPYCNNPMNYNPNTREYKLCKDCKYLKIKESKIENNSDLKSQENLKKNNLLKYGKEYYYQTDEFKEKSRKTCLEKYGEEFHQKTIESKEKISKSSRKMHSERGDEIKSKSISTNLEKYGKEYYQMTKEYLDRSKLTNIELYGVENVMQNKEISKKVIDTINLRFPDKSVITDKIKETSILKYGSEWYQTSEKYKELKKREAQEIIGNEYEIIDVKGRSWTVLCKKCNKIFQTSASFIWDRRERYNIEICTNCNPINSLSSNCEKQVVEFVKSIYNGEIIENSRSIISPYELDIYLPEKQIAIEYNGLLWHSEYKVDKDYHKMKSDMCKELGIHLIHIFEDDWLYKGEIIKSVIKNFLGCGHQTIVYARKCVVKDVNNQDTQKFIEENHLLGKMMMISHSVGLYYQDELVSLMAFRCISKESGSCELSRYAIKRDINVKGGAERIFSNFLKTYGNLYNKVKTFNDNGVFKGTVHYRLGFVHTGNNPPNYMYYDKKLGKRVSKQSLRNIRLSYKQGEQQFLEIDRYFRVYNAGNDTCEFIVNKILNKE